MIKATAHRLALEDVACRVRPIRTTVGGSVPRREGAAVGRQATRLVGRDGTRREGGRRGVRRYRARVRHMFAVGGDMARAACDGARLRERAIRSGPRCHGVVSARSTGVGRGLIVRSGVVTTGRPVARVIGDGARTCTVTFARTLTFAPALTSAVPLVALEVEIIHTALEIRGGVLVRVTRVVTATVRGREVLQHERHPDCICLIRTNRPLTESAGVAFAGRIEVASTGIHWMPFTTPCAVW